MISEHKCPECNGSGWKAEGKVCMVCEGTTVAPGIACAGAATPATDEALREKGRIAAREGKARVPPYNGGAACRLWLEGYDSVIPKKCGICGHSCGGHELFCSAGITKPTSDCACHA